MGSNGSFVVGFSDFGNRQRFFVRKNFPAINNTLESAVRFEDDGNAKKLHLKVLHGCIPDYLQMLEGPTTDLYELIRFTLGFYDAFLLDPGTIINDNFKVNDIGEIKSIVDRFYPH
ncbi:MAG TPA: hypothetical protein VJA18_01800 [Candidatus Nanoarchaeia archaeon]|nr:hypothetical protein [Candidatus Nanoarchaeia archaeon]